MLLQARDHRTLAVLLSARFALGFRGREGSSLVQRKSVPHIADQLPSREILAWPRNWP